MLLSLELLIGISSFKVGNKFYKNEIYEIDENFK
jgi:hypothetical protein